jgi:hypothetical protein
MRMLLIHVVKTVLLFLRESLLAYVSCSEHGSGSSSTHQSS